MHIPSLISRERQEDALGYRAICLFCAPITNILILNQLIQHTYYKGHFLSTVMGYSFEMHLKKIRFILMSQTSASFSLHVQIIAIYTCTYLIW